jgi:16S rRNA (guanine527-N7)-methyltransferase
MFHVKHSVKETFINKDTLTKAVAMFEEHGTALENYIDHLLDWNEKINLVSRTVSRETVREHVVHSLLPACMGLLDDADTWIDSGTGGGLPGVPLSVIYPDKRFILNDNVRKKMKAVESIAGSMNLKNTTVLPKSISLVDVKEGVGIITKHAFKIYDLMRLLKGKPWGKIVMYKGADDVEGELKKTKGKLQVDLYRFDFNHPFYEGKGLVVLKR